MGWKALDKREEEMDRLSSLPDLSDTHGRIKMDMESHEKKDDQDWPQKTPVDRIEQYSMKKFLQPEKIIDEDEDLDLRSLTTMIEDQEESEEIKRDFIGEVKQLLEKELFEKVLDEVENMEKNTKNLSTDIHNKQKEYEEKS